LLCWEVGHFNCLEEGLVDGGRVDWGSNGGLVDGWSGSEVSWLSVSDWGNGLDDWGSNGDLRNSWGGTVNNGVESVDGVGGVGDGTDGTIGLDKGVLSLDNISVTGLVGGFLVTSQGIGDGVSVVVLWMGVEGLSADGWDDSLGNSHWSGVLDNWSGISHWSYGLGDHGGVVGEWGVVGRGSSISWCGVTGVGWCKNSGTGAACEGKDGDDLDHDDVFRCGLNRSERID